MNMVKVMLLDGPRAGDTLLADAHAAVVTTEADKKTWRESNTKPVQMCAYRVVILSGAQNIGSSEPAPIYHVGMQDTGECPIKLLIECFQPHQRKERR